jgi:hypothetical protein
LGAVHSGHSKRDGWRANCPGEGLEGVATGIGGRRDFQENISAIAGDRASISSRIYLAY